MMLFPIDFMYGDIVPLISPGYAYYFFVIKVKRIYPWDTVEIYGTVYQYGLDKGNCFRYFINTLEQVFRDPVFEYV